MWGYKVFVPNRTPYLRLLIVLMVVIIELATVGWWGSGEKDPKKSGLVGSPWLGVSLREQSQIGRPAQGRIEAIAEASILSSNKTEGIRSK